MAEVIFEEPPHEQGQDGHPSESESASTPTATSHGQVEPEPGNGTPHTDAPPPPDHRRTESAHSTLSLIHSPRPRRPSTSTIDRDAQDQVISSLRLQIQDLISQVSQLNAKLVKSYDRVSDLEDDLHVASSSLRASSLKISQLELERTQHLSALNTGLLVEKTHVTAELNRLMERATEEAAQRGQAESARMAIEKDLDDLSASLFGQANAMVAEARFEKHLSERKVEDAERALKSAEEAVQVMQQQMQAMQAEREDAERRAREAEVIMGRGKWVQRGEAGSTVPTLRLLSTHTPYVDYLAFIAHLRVLHPSSPHATPAMSTLLQLPFLVRLMTEDSEPTVRLDLAPSLNWLSRRSVLAAIHSGQLTIEPVPASSLFPDPSSNSSSSSFTGYSVYSTGNTTVAGMNSSGDNVSCALCGTSIFPGSPAENDAASSSQNAASSWSGATASFFKNKKASVNGLGMPSSPTRSSSSATRRSSLQHLSGNTQIFIFRLASPPSSGIASLPLPLPSLTKSTSQSGSSSALPSSSSSAATPSSSASHLPYSSASFGPSAHSHSSTTHTHTQLQTPTQTQTQSQPSTIYPLCTSGWCLARLRTTCTLWAFVRTGIVDRVWEEAIAAPPPPAHPAHPARQASRSASLASLSNSNGNGTGTGNSVHSSSQRNAQVPPDHLPPSSLGNGDRGGERPPPVPPRKRGIWGIASALGERAVSWGGSGGGGGGGGQAQTVKEENKDKEENKALPPAPPPQHPSLVHTHGQGQTQETGRRVPPLPASMQQQQAPPAHNVTSTSTPPPPPLPRRSEGRSRTPVQSQQNASTPPPSAEGQSSASAPTTTHLQPNATPSANTNSTNSSHSQPPAPPLPPRTHTRTPSSVPLPESRPSTPAGPSASVAPLSQAQGPPSRATSPAIPPQGAQGAQGAQGQAPPPIPRRAAARARGAVGAGGGAGGGSRPGTPANANVGGTGAGTGERSPVTPVREGGAEEVKASAVTIEADKGEEEKAKVEEEHKDEKEGEKKAEDESEAASVPSVPPPADAEKKIEEQEQEGQEGVVPSGEDVFVDAPTPGPGGARLDTGAAAPNTNTAEAQKAETKAADEQTPTGLEETEGKKDGETVPVQRSAEGDADADGDGEFVHVDINGNGAHKEKDQEKDQVTASPISLTASDNVVQGPNAKLEDKEERDAQEKEKEREQKAKEEKEKDRLAAANYIGDATWEERTWKELVRLREDMFWARVGAFREVK